MHSSIALLALAALARAAPVAQKDAPDSYFEGYLEPYMTYHTRYITIGCSGQQGTQFFDDCCSPMLATETLEEARKPYCAPNATESASASASAASATDSASAPVQTESADYEAQSEYAHAIPSSAVTTSTWSQPAPTSTWSPEPAPETTQQSSNNNGGGDSHNGGFATYFYQNGNPGACGNYNSDSDYGVAIDHEVWGSNFGSPSSDCGRQVRITNTNNGKTVTATVWDVCPTCANGNSLDLSEGAFLAIATKSEGMVPISWSFA